MLHVLLCLATMQLTLAHPHTNDTHIIATQSLSTSSPTNYPNLTNLDLGIIYASSTDTSSTDTVLVLMLSLGAFAVIAACFILSFKLFLTWRDHSEQYVNKKTPRLSVLSISRPSRSREPTASADARDPEAVRKESVLTEIWNDAETTHELESGYQEHITSKTHDTDAITEAPSRASARQRVGSTGYIEAIFAQYNQPQGNEHTEHDAEDEAMETEMGVEEHEDEEKQVVLDVHDELYRSPTKKYRIAVSSIDDLEPFDINESFEATEERWREQGKYGRGGMARGSVTPPHRENAEEHSLEMGHGEEVERERGRGHVRGGVSVSSVVSVESAASARSRSRSVESMAGFEAEESVEESSEELVGPHDGEMETQGLAAGYVD